MSILRDRIPFAAVVADKKLMGKIWNTLSMPQQVVLKAAYGQPLTTNEEMAAWAILNDNVKSDELYYPTAIIPTPYEPREYRTVVGLIGRRSGKSFISCFAALYEIIFGGHTNPNHILEGQEVIVPYVAQDLATAKINMRTIALLAKMVPMLEDQIAKSLPDVIEFKNGIKVIPEPPVIKTGRGVAIPFAILDEVGFWYKTSDAVNPDVEVERAISPAMTQFPNRKMFIISSPYTEEGILWEYSKAGTAGIHAPLDKKAKYANALVMQASTAAMANPTLIRAGLKDTLEEEQAKDPEGFIREYGARFVSAISGYLPQHLVQAAIDKGVGLRKRAEIEKHLLVPFYIAAMDPAFRHDSWAFTIFHRDQFGRVIQDVLQVWTPNKKRGIILNPAIIMSEIDELCKAWNVKFIYSDQAHFDSLQQIALQFKLPITEVPFTGASKAGIFGSLLSMLRQGNLRLLDNDAQYQQLVQLQKKMTAMGGIQISAPKGRHDDIACALALGISKAMSAYPRFAVVKKEKTLFDEGLDCIRRKREHASSEGVWV